MLRDIIIGAQDIRFEDVHVPEWGCTVRIKCMDSKTRDNLEIYLAREKEKLKNEDDYLECPRARFLVWVLHDPETDKLIFSPNDTEMLATKCATVVSSLYDKAKALEQDGVPDKVKD